MQSFCMKSTVAAASINSVASDQIGVVLASAVSEYLVAFVNMGSDAAEVTFYRTLWLNPVLLNHQRAIVAETVLAIYYLRG